MKSLFKAQLLLLQFFSKYFSYKWTLRASLAEALKLLYNIELQRGNNKDILIHFYLLLTSLLESQIHLYKV